MVVSKGGRIEDTPNTLYTRNTTQKVNAGGWHEDKRTFFMCKPF